MKKTTAFIIMTLIILSTTFITVGAVNIPEATEDFYVADYANVLKSDTVDYIVQKNAELYSQTGAQIVIVTVNGLGGESISRYANSIFNGWGIGSADKNNGLLLLMSIGDDDYWVTQGKGLEESLSSGVLGNMLDEYLEPDFAKGDYDDGVRSFFDAAYEAVTKLYTMSESPSNGSYNNADDYYYNSSYGYNEPEGVISRVFGGVKLVGTIIVIIIIISIFSAISSLFRGIGRIGRGFGRGFGGGWYNMGGGFRGPRPPRPPFGGNHWGGGPPRGGFGGGSFGGGGRSSGGFGGGRSGGGSHRGGGGSSRGGGAGRGRR